MESRMPPSMKVCESVGVDEVAVYSYTFVMLGRVQQTATMRVPSAETARPYEPGK